MIIEKLVDKILFYYFNRKKKDHHIYQYLANSTLIKSDHMPHMAFRLLEGAVIVYSKKNKLIGVFGPHSTWGTSALTTNQVSKFTVYIVKGSRVCAFGKSELKKSIFKILNILQTDTLEQI